MPKCIFRHTACREVFCGQHTTGSHNSHKGVEFGVAWILFAQGQSVHAWSARDLLLTTHRSSDSARAFEEETSNDIPFRFCKRSCNVSKFVFGGGICRLWYQRDEYEPSGNIEKKANQPQNCCLRISFLYPLRNADVRKQHELLYQAIGFQLSFLLDIDRFWSSFVRVEVDLEFR